MYKDVLIAFSVFQFVFLLLDLFILTKTGRNIARKGEYTWFCVLICTHAAYLVFNSVWTLSEYGVLRLPRAAIFFVCTCSLWTVTNCAASFFLFMVEKLHLTRLQVGAGLWLRQLPSVLTTILIGTSPWTGLAFRLDENGAFVHGPLYLLNMLIAGLYLFAVAALALRNIFRRNTKFLRKANATLFGSVLVILAFVVADASLSRASILPAAIFACITVIFVTMQEANINSDALTGMNNRRKAEEYLADKVEDVSEKAPLWLYMADVNNFKKINDTYGHVAGDEALILTSQVLKRTISEYDGFAARYGGDEFLLSWQPKKGTDSDPDSLMQAVNERLAEAAKGKPYRLVMTMGYVYCTDPKEALSSYIRRADSMLYQRKAAAGVGR